MKVDIKKKDGKWTVEFCQGVQSFRLDYLGSREEANWMKSMLEKAFMNWEEEILREANNETTI